MLFTCPDCDKELGTERGLKSHYGQVHKGSLRNTTECKRCGDNFPVWPSQEDKRVQCSDCFNEYGVHNSVREKIREKMEGREIKWADEISETLSGEGNYWYGVRGEDHPAYGFEPPQELRDKWSEQRKGHEPYGGVEWHEVEATGHKVRSSWEKEIDLLLHEHDVEYDYEPRQLKLSDGRGYLPDFVVDNRAIIEVKGYADDVSKEKSKMVVEEFPEYEYIVIGSDVGTGFHIPWEDRENIIDVLTGVK